jgi:hypothetical protein
MERNHDKFPETKKPAMESIKVERGFGNQRAAVA